MAKRVRIDPSATDGTPRLSPLGEAEKHIQNHLVSLQPQLSSVLEKLGTQHLKTLVKYVNKQKQISRMETDDALIPRSARVAFSLNVMKKAEEPRSSYVLGTIHRSSSSLFKKV